MASVDEVINDTINALGFAVMALEAPEKASMRDTLADLIDARRTVADMLTALERIVQVELNGGSAIGMRHIAADALKAAKGGS